jgi:hypothetical protein
VCVPGEDVKKQRPAISIKMSDFGNNLSLAGEPKKKQVPARDHRIERERRISLVVVLFPTCHPRSHLISLDVAVELSKGVPFQRPFSIVPYILIYSEDTR